MSAPTLLYYDTGKPLNISVNASGYSIGAVLMQEGCLIDHASKSLIDCQQGYAQIEKELLGVLHRCTRFHKYIVGCREMTIEMDHKPLISLCQKHIIDVSSRLARMIMKLLPMILGWCTTR